jgi:hypothetical protein
MVKGVFSVALLRQKKWKHKNRKTSEAVFVLRFPYLSQSRKKHPKNMMSFVLSSNEVSQGLEHHHWKVSLKIVQNTEIAFSRGPPQ